MVHGECRIFPATSLRSKMIRWSRSGREILREVIRYGLLAHLALLPLRVLVIAMIAGDLALFGLLASALLPILVPSPVLLVLLLIRLQV